MYIHTYIHIYGQIARYRVAKTHRMSYLCRSFFAKETYN